jgi:hypothetical protein
VKELNSKARKVRLRRKQERQKFVALPDWTPREAQEAQQKYIKAGGDPKSRNQPIYEWHTARHLLELRARFEAGDKGVILRAVAECARMDKVMPEWLVQAFLTAWRDVIHYKAKSWDEVFGRAHPKGMNLRAARKKWTLKYAVQNAVNEESKKGRSINDELFAEIGKRFNIGVTLAKEYNAERMTLPREVRALLAPFRNPAAAKAKRKRR